MLQECKDWFNLGTKLYAFLRDSHPDYCRYDNYPSGDEYCYFSCFSDARGYSNQIKL